MRKKQGKSFNLYLQEDLMARAKLEADTKDRSTSFIVNLALKLYFSLPEEKRKVAA